MPSIVAWVFRRFGSGGAGRERTGRQSVFSAIFGYAVASRIAACLLLLAGASKAHEFLTQEYDQISVLSLVFSTAEATFAVWILFGLKAQWSRLALIALFLLFMNVAFSQALAEMPSCNCFGRVPVRPWIVFAVDLAVATSLFFVPGGPGGPTVARKRWIGFGATATGVVVAAAAVAGSRLMTWGDGTDGDSPRAHRLVEQVCEAIDRNHSAYQSLQFSMTWVHEDPGIKEEREKIYRNDKGEITEIIFESPRVEQKYRYILRGPDFRQDILAGLGAGSLSTCFRGRALHYSPENNRAVARDAQTASNGSDPDDPRCLGFEIPLLSVPDWIRRRKVTEVKTYQGNDDEGIEIRFHLIRGRDGDTTYVEADWVVRFSARHNYLPVRVDVFEPDGQRGQSTVFSYQALANGSFWFLKKMKTELGEASEPSAGADTSKKLYTSTYEVTGDIVVNAAVDDSAFDFELPPDVSLASATKKVSHANFRNAKTFFDLFAPPEEGAAEIRRTFWPYVAGLNFAFFCTLWGLRRYWQF